MMHSKVVIAVPVLMRNQNTPSVGIQTLNTFPEPKRCKVWNFELPLQISALLDYPSYRRAAPNNRSDIYCQSWTAFRIERWIASASIPTHCSRRGLLLETHGRNRLPTSNVIATKKTPDETRPLRIWTIERTLRDLSDLWALGPHRAKRLASRISLIWYLEPKWLRWLSESITHLHRSHTCPKYLTT